MKRIQEQIGLPLLKDSTRQLAILLNDSRKHKRVQYTVLVVQAVLWKFDLSLHKVSLLLAAMEAEGLVREHIKMAKNWYVLSTKALTKFLDGDTDEGKMVEEIG